jgi:hypothetical protein
VHSHPQAAGLGESQPSQMAKDKDKQPYAVSGCCHILRRSKELRLRQTSTIPTNIPPQYLSCVPKISAFPFPKYHVRPSCLNPPQPTYIQKKVMQTRSAVDHSRYAVGMSRELRLICQRPSSTVSAGVEARVLPGRFRETIPRPPRRYILKDQKFAARPLPGDSSNFCRKGSPSERWTDRRG